MWDSKCVLDSECVLCGYRLSDVLSGGRAVVWDSRRVAGSIPPWVCRSVPEQDRVTPNVLLGRAECGTLHGSQSPLCV